MRNALVLVAALGLHANAVAGRFTNSKYKSRRCGQILAGPTPTTVQSVGHARNLIQAGQYVIAHYLDAEQVKGLCAVLERGHNQMNSPDGDQRSLSALIEFLKLAQDAVAEDFSKNERDYQVMIEQKIADACATNNGGASKKLGALLTRLEDATRRGTFEDFIRLFADLNRARAVTFAPILPKATPTGLVDRPSEAAGEFVFLNPARRAKFKSELERSFHARSAVQRERRRDRDSARGFGADDRFAFVADINHTLGAFFITSPKVWPQFGKVALTGRVRIGSTAPLVAVTFDPRLRYFVVQPPRNNNQKVIGYYRLNLNADGYLEFVSSEVLTLEEAARWLHSTHFGY